MGKFISANMMEQKVFQIIRTTWGRKANRFQVFCPFILALIQIFLFGIGFVIGTNLNYGIVDSRNVLGITNLLIDPFHASKPNLTSGKTLTELAENLKKNLSVPTEAVVAQKDDDPEKKRALVNSDCY